VLDVLEQLGKPPAVTLDQIKTLSPPEIVAWMNEPKNHRAIPHRLEGCGYVTCRNKDAKDGYWRVKGKRRMIYVQRELSEEAQTKAILELQAQVEAQNPSAAVIPLRTQNIYADSA